MRPWTAGRKLAVFGTFPYTLSMPKILPILNYLQPEMRELLRRPADPVVFTELQQPAFQAWLDDLIVTMQKADGAGLAAPQVGRSIRAAVITQPDDPLGAPLVVINPTLDQFSSEEDIVEEGCLSVPRVYGLVKRPIGLRLRALDRQGQPLTLFPRGLQARIFQHEVDHLHGRLFIDRAIEFTRGKKLLP